MTRDVTPVTSAMYDLQYCLRAGLTDFQASKGLSEEESSRIRWRLDAAITRKNSARLQRIAQSHSNFQSLAEQLSYLDAPRPFKNPNYAKKTFRRSKNLKAVLTQEREREKAERERRRLEKIESGMDVDGEQEEEFPTCELFTNDAFSARALAVRSLVRPRYVNRGAAVVVTPEALLRYHWPGGPSFQTYLSGLCNSLLFSGPVHGSRNEAAVSRQKYLRINQRIGESCINVFCIPPLILFLPRALVLSRNIWQVRAFFCDFR